MKRGILYIASTDGTNFELGSFPGPEFNDPTEGIPAFITIMTMPFAYSISDGIAWGIISYVICKVTARKIKEIPIVTWILAIIFTGNFIFEAIKG